MSAGVLTETIRNPVAVVSSRSHLGRSGRAIEERRSSPYDTQNTVTVSGGSTWKHENGFSLWGGTILLSAGLRSLTTNEVARRAKVSKKTLYRLFESKESLAETILPVVHQGAVCRSGTPSLTAIGRSRCACGSPSHSWNGSFRNFSQAWWPTSPRWIRSYGRRSTAFDVRDSDGSRTSSPKRSRPASSSPDIDADQWFLLFLSTIQNAVTPKTLLEQNIMLSDLIRTARRIYFDGLLTPDGRRALSGVPKEIR